MPQFDPDKYLKSDVKPSDFDPDKYLGTKSVEKKNSFQNDSQIGSEPLPIGSKPFQAQVDTKIPSVLTPKGKVGYEQEVQKQTQQKQKLSEQLKGAKSAFVSAQGEDVARDIEMYQADPDAFRDIETNTSIGNSIRQGLLTGELANVLPVGREPNIDELQKIADINYKISRIPQSEASKVWEKEGLKIFKDPLLGSTFLAETIGSSLAGLYESGKRTVPASAGIGAAAGAPIGGIGALPGAGVGVMAGISVAGLNLSTSSDIMSSLKDSGVDITDRDALIKAFSNENKMSEIRTNALKYGVPIMAFDVASAGIAGKLIGGAAGKSIAKKIIAGAGEAGIQSVAGSAGELSGQLVSGKKINWNEVALEGIASLATDAPDVAIGYLGRDKSSSNNKNIVSQINKLGVEVGVEDAKLNLDRDLANGVIAPEEYQEGIEFIGKVVSANEKIPIEVEGDNREVSIELVTQKENVLSDIEALEERKAQTDDAYHPIIDNEIKFKQSQVDEINAKIQEEAIKPKITKQLETPKPQEDAVQVEAAGQVPVLTEAPVGEEVEQGKPQPEAKVVAEEGKEEVTPALRDVDSTAKALETLENETPILETQKTLRSKNLRDLDIVSSKESSSALESEIGGDIGGIDNKVRTIPIQEYDVTENNRSRQIAEQIEENGWIEPLIVSYDKNGNVYIVEGQHRAAALKQLGYDKAPVILIYDKSSNVGKAVEQTLAQESKEEVDGKYKKIIESIPVSQTIDGVKIHEIKTTKEIADILGISTNSAYSYLMSLGDDKANRYGYLVRGNWQPIEGGSNPKAQSVGWQISSSQEQTPAQQVEQLRAEEQAELKAAIPNADQYLTDGKVDRAKITDSKDLKKFDKIYDKYDKLITPLLPKSVTKEDVKDLASKIRGLKINLGKGTAQSNIAGLPIALYNSTVEAVALFIEAGSTISEAIDKAIKKYNLDKVNGFNKSELSKNIQESSKPQKAKSVKDIDVNKIRTQNRPGKRISKGLNVKNVRGEKIVEESDNLSAEYVKENAPDVFINNANILTKYPIVAGIKKFGEIKNIEDAQQVYDIFIRQVADNLKNLTNDYNPEFRDIATLWYDGANILANKLSSEYNVTPEQAAGIIAAMSPQKDWYMNVRLAELVMLAYKQDAVLTNDMIAKQIEIIKIGEKPFLKNISDAKKALQKNRTKENVKKSIDAQEKYNNNKENADKVIELLKKYVGVNINSVPKAIQPYIIRLNSELNNSKDFNILRPDGEVVGVAKTIGGENKKIAWGSYSEIGKAASIYNDGSQENITRSLGEMHKIRNFYNNIIDPMSKDGDVTIDTHAVAAALMQPLSGNSKQVGQNFGTGTSNSGTLGIKGLYYAYLDAYNLAARELGLLPRQVQSITWEAVRGLFTDTFKRDTSKVKKINDIWKNYEDGNITIEQTRRDVTESAGGIKDPTWAKSILPEPEDGVEQGSIGGGVEVSGPDTVGEPSTVRVAAKTLRKLKIDLGKGTAQSNIAGLPIALYNSVIETIALGLEAGDSLSTAIKNSIEKYKLNKIKDFNRNEFISKIENAVSEPAKLNETNVENAIELLDEIEDNKRKSERASSKRKAELDQKIADAESELESISKEAQIVKAINDNFDKIKKDLKEQGLLNVKC